MPLSVVDFVLPFALSFVFWRISVVYSAIATYGRADIYPAFPPLSIPGLFFGMGLTWPWHRKPDAYGSKECLRITPLLWGHTVLYTRSPDVLRQVAGGGSNKTWIKPAWASGGVMLFGTNLVSENLDDWRRHRRIMQPSFTKSTYELVWRETTRLYEDMVKAEKWDTKPGGVVTIKSMNQLTFKLGLTVIGCCGFGLASKFKWDDPAKSNSGHGNVQSNILTIETFSLLLVVAPRWLWRLPSTRLRSIWREFKSLQTFIDSEVAQRRAMIDEALQNGGEDALESVNQDVFSRLVLANQADGKQSLSSSELVGNTFVLLFAGHDTTASTLAAAIALLAYYEEEQEKAYREVAKTIEENPHFDFSLSSQLPYVAAIFLEAVRLYPAGEVAIRACLEDTILKAPSADGKGPTTDYVMPKGSEIIVDFVGMQYHPQCFLDPVAFKPSRWIGAGEDSATAFSAGPRACIGKKFAQTEATCFLTNLLRDYQIRPLLNAGETREGWKKRILGNINIIPCSRKGSDACGGNESPNTGCKIVLLSNGVAYVVTHGAGICHPLLVPASSHAMFRYVPRRAPNVLDKQMISLSRRHYSGPPHFYSNKQLELLASKTANRLSLRQLVFFGRSMTEERLIMSANYVRTELPVRIAHRIRDMQSLPFSVVTEENVAKIYALYWDAFEKLRNYPEVVTREDNDKFCEFLRTILNEHAAAIPILSLGLSIASPHLSPDDLDSFMRRMLVSRISRRVLAEHHLALTESFVEQERSPNGGGNVGIIFTGLIVKRSLDKFIRLLLSPDTMPERLRQGLALLGIDKTPEIIVDGQLDATFSYIREHLEYILLELLLNSIKATAIQMQNKRELVPGVIRATISSDEDEVYVRISDQGGGLMLQESQTPSDLYSFSHLRNNTRLNDDRIGALQHFSQRKGGLLGTVNETISSPGETSNETPVPRQMGIGLPLSNIYATYFGGTLELVSMDGWGTDVYLRLPRLGTNLEGIEV